MRRIGVLLAALALIGPAASAPLGSLQLKRILATRQGPLCRLRIEMRDPWASSVLRPGGPLLRVYYDVNQDKRADYTGRILYRGGALQDYITGKNSAFEPVPVTRPSRTAARFTHPIDVLFPNPDKPGLLQIAVSVRVGGKTDRLPRTGWFAIPAPPPGR